MMDILGRTEKKKYYIYGENRATNDFRYIFDNIINIIGQMGIDDSFKKPHGASVIMCGPDKSKYIYNLERLGFVYGHDCYYYEDFFPLIDDFYIPSGRKIAVWGIGKMAAYLLENEEGLLPDIFIDSYSNNKEYNERKVVRPDEIVDLSDYFIIVAVADCSEINEYLVKNGLQENVDYISYAKYIERPSKMLRQTMFDQNQYDLDCRTMLNHLEILRDGETSCCCTTFLEKRLGSVLTHTKDEIWNSVRHKVLCLSTENRTYTFCDKSMCPLFVNRKKVDGTIGEDREYRKMEPSPETLVLGYDDTCNLYCSTCRKERYVPSAIEKEKHEIINQEIINHYLQDAKFMVMAGGGEVLMSPNYRKVYTSDKCKPQYIRLLSNGMLFDKNHWEQMVAGKEAKMMLTVSIDAATKGTYESIRRGGNFDILKKNMEYAAELHRSGELAYFRINFVVQRENYREMPLFVEWGKALGVNEVFFTKILNWGTYSDEEFRDISMMESDGITPKKELVEIMNMPVMNDAIVDMGTIQALHKEDTVDVVENYYMWELEKRGGRLFEL